MNVTALNFILINLGKEEMEEAGEDINIHKKDQKNKPLQEEIYFESKGTDTK